MPQDVRLKNIGDISNVCIIDGKYLGIPYPVGL